ncbi:MAG: hypothetical protein IJH78_02490, partial [Clostridia bacterium]|nr:hypothetical protein [Clostridia bacterium]
MTTKRLNILLAIALAALIVIGVAGFGSGRGISYYTGWGKTETVPEGDLYTSEKENSFSTVKVDAWVKDAAITGCKITTGGDNDLMTDELRES